MTTGLLPDHLEGLAPLLQDERALDRTKFDDDPGLPEPEFVLLEGLQRKGRLACALAGELTADGRNSELEGQLRTAVNAQIGREIFRPQYEGRSKLR